MKKILASNKSIISKILWLAIILLLTSIIPTAPEAMATVHYAWLATDGRRPADDGNGTVSFSSDRAPLNGRLDLTVNMERVQFTSAVFEISYDSNLVYDPQFNDPQRTDLTSRGITYTDLGNGWRKATINLAGDVTIGDISNFDIGDITTHSTLFELALTPRAEGTIPLGLWPQNNLPVNYATCSLQVFNDNQPVLYASKPANEDIVLFTFTDKSNVSYYYDYNLGTPLTNGTMCSIINQERNPIAVIPDSYGGYFFDSSPGCTYEWQCPPYPIGDPANFHGTTWIQPDMLPAQPRSLTSSNDDASFTVNITGIGTSFNADQFSLHLYTLDSDSRTQEVVKTAAFAAIDDDNIRVTVTGGLQTLDNNAMQFYNLYLSKQRNLLGRIYCSVQQASQDTLQITSRLPIQGASQIALNAGVTINFGTALNPATVNSNSIIVTKSNGDAVEGGYNVALQGENQQAAITFPQGLQAETSYTVTVGTAVQDVTGQSLAAPDSWNFSTVSNAVPVSPFTVELQNGNGQWVAGTNLNNVAMGVYYYFDGQTISLRLTPRPDAALPPAYQLGADIDSIVPGSDLVPLVWDEANHYWTLNYTIPSPSGKTGPCSIPVIMSIGGQQQQQPMAILMAIMNINPKDFNIGLGGDTTDWSTITDFNSINSLIFERVDNSDPQNPVRIARLVLGDAEHPINVCELDENANPITATALQNLQQNMEMAYNKMSIDTAANALAAFNKPASITFYNLTTSVAPGVNYVSGTGVSQAVVQPGGSNFINGQDRVKSFSWDAQTRTLTITVDAWSGYELVSELHAPVLYSDAATAAVADVVNPSPIYVTTPQWGHVYVVPKGAYTTMQQLEDAVAAARGASIFVGADSINTVQTIDIPALNLAPGIYELYAVEPAGITGISAAANWHVVIGNEATSDLDLQSDGSDKIVAITANTVNLGQPVNITVPAAVNDAQLNVGNLLNAPAAGQITTAALPQLNISAQTSISPTPVQVAIPADTIVSAAANSNWDGTINVPTVRANNTVNVTPDAGKTAAVSSVIEVGYGDIPLTFTKAVKLTIPGQAGKDAGYYRNGVFTKITATAAENSQTWADANIAEGSDARIDVNNDLIIWTKHFTQFVTYSQTAIPAGGNGGGGSAPVTNASAITAASGGTVSSNGATITIPAHAMASDIKVTVEKVTNTANLTPAGEARLISEVVEIVKDKSGSFDKPVTINLTFDQSKVDPGKYDVKICWYNEDTGTWLPLDNVTVDTVNSRVSGEVSHFTKFAVIAFPKDQKPEPKPVVIKDIKGSWAENSIVKLVQMGAISGYPDETFRPDNTITRAEFCSVLVKALKLEPKTGKVFNDTASHWAKDMIATAAAYGIVSGTSDTTFAPDAFITREQMAVMIYKAAKIAPTTSGKDFTDNASISPWAREAVKAASEHQIINGYPDNSFKPQGLTTRAEAVTVIAKIIK